MDDSRQAIANGADRLGIELSERQIEQSERYLALLQKWNRAYNLTAIQDIDEMRVKHLLDSFSIQPFLQKTNLLDVGSGAGLPSIPMAILNPNLPISSMDSNSKKTRFQNQARIELELSNLEVIHGRVEQLQDRRFDQIVSRAFASLKDMITVSERLLSSTGIFLAMKGRYPEEELAVLPAGYQLQHCYPLQIPSLNEERHLLVIGRA